MSARELHDQMTYKGVLLEGMPNLAWIFGYTNAPWTLKSDIAGEYLCRLLKHMDDHGQVVATPRDRRDRPSTWACFDQLQSGYVQRAKETLPRQGDKNPGRSSCTTARTRSSCWRIRSTTVSCGSSPSASTTRELVAAAGARS